MNNNYECPNCGNVMNETEDKCRYCGTANPNYSSVTKMIRKVVPGTSNQDNMNYSSKSRIACGLLQLFFGGLGIGRFYSGHIGIGVAQLLLNVFTCGTVGSIWGFIDGIIILTNSKFTDSDGKIMK